VSKLLCRSSQGREDDKATKSRKSSAAASESVDKPSSKRSKDIAGSGSRQKSVENRLIQLSMAVTAPGQTADVKDTASRSTAGKMEITIQQQSMF